MRFPMVTSGFSHIGLATHDMASTIVFYELLGFARVADIVNDVQGGGSVRMVYIACGEEQFLVFMECKGIADIPEDFDTGINSSLGVPKGLYHFAFRVESLDELEEKKRELTARGLNVSEQVDHGYARSIFLRDPNDLQLEFCCLTRKFDLNDLQQQKTVQVAAVPRASEETKP
jgi:catechol 2,3-dioxygenase-like lactoylglutathione lyase family enzyme